VAITAVISVLGVPRASACYRHQIVV